MIYVYRVCVVLALSHCVCVVCMGVKAAFPMGKQEAVYGFFRNKNLD